MLDSQSSDNQQFQKAEDDIEYLSFNKTQNIERFIENNRHSRKVSLKENVNLKFEKIHHHNPKFINKNPNKNKNISFESEQLNSDNNLETYVNSSNDGISSLANYYRNHQHAQLVYKKTRNIGTNWIGEKEYCTSLFANAEMIEKSRGKCLFGKILDELPNQGGLSLQNPMVKTCPISNDIQFDSDFQSGNLYAVYKVGSLEYDLLLQNDINTKGNTQWFYFRMVNLPPNKNIKLNIVNFRKPDSLFNYGMIPCFHSVENQKKKAEKWIRRGDKVKYFRNSHLVEGTNKRYYTLTFSIWTEYDKDVVRIAQSYPYTYGDLNNWIEQIHKVNYKRSWCQKVCVLNKTLGGNSVDSLVIKQQNSRIKYNQSRPLILLFARQHPGETPGSFMIEGLVQYFLSKEKDSEFLRKNFQIRAIPMVNPDGVQVGNYRTNLYGVDLNRKWDCSTKDKDLNKGIQKQQNNNLEAHQIIHIKRYIATHTKGRQIAYIIDFHGHSRKLYSFFYGNHFPQSPTDVKMFPFVCSKLTSMIRFQDCTFNIEEDKRSTARVQMYQGLKIPTIYTFEASFFGYIGKNGKKKHFTVQSYRNLGTIIGKAIYICQKRKEQLPLNVESKEKFLYEKWLRELTSTNLLVVGENEDSGSENCPEECEVADIEKKILQDEFAAYQQENFSKYKSNSTTKKARQKFRHENLNSAKQPMKSLRQMQVLEITRVNSIFPHSNDILALVPNNFYMKSTVRVKKILITAGTQTDECPLVKVYETCKNAQIDFQGKINNNADEVRQNKSEILDKANFKSTSLKNETYTVQDNIPSTMNKNELKNISTLCITRSKSIHQKQLFQNARQLNAIKKSNEIRKNFKKVMTENHLSKPKSSLIGGSQGALINRRKINRYVQTLICFHTKGIIRNFQLMNHTQEEILYSNESTPNNKSHHQIKNSTSPTRLSFETPERKQIHKSRILQNPHNYWTIETKHRSIGVELKQFQTPISRNHMRKTFVVSKNIFTTDSLNTYETQRKQKNDKMIEKWRIKKKSLI